MKSKPNMKDFYCPNSGVCTCAATGKKKPANSCWTSSKRKGK